jgi:hypothetical protein
VPLEPNPKPSRCARPSFTRVEISRRSNYANTASTPSNISPFGSLVSTLLSSRVSAHPRRAAQSSMSAKSRVLRETRSRRTAVRTSISPRSSRSTVLTLSVIQLGIALLIRNTVRDAASEGARYAALADNHLADGAERTRNLINTAIGPSCSNDIRVREGRYRGHPAAIATVVTPLPLVDFFGPRSRIGSERSCRARDPSLLRGPAWRKRALA